MTYSTKKSKIYVLALAFLFSFSLLTLGVPGVPGDGLTLTDQDEDAGILYPGDSAVVQEITVVDSDDTDDDVTVTSAEIDNLGDAAAGDIAKIEVMQGDVVKGSTTSISSWPVGVNLTDFIVPDDTSATVKIKVTVANTVSTSNLQLQTNLIQNEGSTVGLEQAANDGVAEKITLNTKENQLVTFHNGTWWVDANNNYSWDPGSDTKIVGYGNDTNKVAIGDLDGDGADELVTFHNGTWWVDANNNYSWDGTAKGDIKLTNYGNALNQVAVGVLSESNTISSGLGLHAPKGLALSSAMAYPNPVSANHAVTFSVKGAGIEETKVEVFSVSGSKVFSSGYKKAKTLNWDLSSENGKVANGVYLYRVEVKGEKASLASGVQKLLVLQ